MERFLHYTIEKEKAQFLSALKDRVSLRHKTQKNLWEKRFILLLLRHRVVSCYDVEHGKGRYLASSNRRRVRKTIESIEQETRKGKSQWRPTDYEEGTPTLKTLYRQFENQHIIITGIKSPGQIGETLSAIYITETRPNGTLFGRVFTLDIL